MAYVMKIVERRSFVLVISRSVYSFVKESIIFYGIRFPEIFKGGYAYEQL